MRIRTLLSASLVAAMVLVLAMGVVNWQLAQRMSALSVTLAQADATARRVSSLLVLTHEYALHGEERAAQQWKEGLAEFGKRTSAGDGAVALPLAQFPDALHRQAATLGELFEQLEAASQPAETPLQIRRKQLLLGQILTNASLLSEGVERWKESIKVKHEEADRQSHRLSLAIPVVALVLFAALTVLMERRVLRPLVRLHAAVNAVAQGDLTVRSASAVNDELGELSRSFDAMAIDMVADLRREVAQRQQAETALRQQADALCASNAELETFNRTMVDRELRMIELKEEINALCRRLGESPSHDMRNLETEGVSGVSEAPAEPSGGGA